MSKCASKNPAEILQFERPDSMQEANVGCGSADDAMGLKEARSSETEFRYAVANPPEGLAQEIYKTIVAPARLRMSKPVLTAKNLGLEVKHIFSTSAKLNNSSDFGWWTPGLYLASGTVAETGRDLCTHASDGCRLNCLLVSGQREMFANTAMEVNKRLKSGREKLGGGSNISILRTYLYEYGRKEFDAMLYRAIEKEQEYAKEQDLALACRLNATSDIPWERTGVIEHFPEVVFYDYTKIPNRVLSYLSSKAPMNFGKVGVAHKIPSFVSTNPPFPSNYYLNFSYSEINMAWCLIMLGLGANVVVPFDGSLGKDDKQWEFKKQGNKILKKALLPKNFLGHPVVDGDAFDIRFIDNQFWNDKLKKSPPFIIGLRIKGSYQKRNKNAFFFSAKEAEAFGSSDDFIAEAVYHNTAECLAQGKKSLLPPLELAKKHLTPRVFDSYLAATKGV